MRYTRLDHGTYFCIYTARLPVNVFPFVFCGPPFSYCELRFCQLWLLSLRHSWLCLAFVLRLIYNQCIEASFSYASYLTSCDCLNRVLRNSDVHRPSHIFRRYTWRLRQVNETQVYIFVWCDIEKTIPDRYAVIQHIFTHGLVMKYLIFAHTIEQCRWTWCSHAMLVICCLGLGSGKETNGIHDTTIQSMIK